MGGRGGTSGRGGGGGNKLRSMTSEQREDFMAAYNLSGAEFKNTHSLNQAYDAAIKKYNEYSEKNGGSGRTGNSAAVKGMEFIQHENSSKTTANNTVRLNKLKDDYFKMIKGQKGAKDEKAQINLLGIGRANIEQRIKRFKEKGHL